MDEGEGPGCGVLFLGVVTLPALLLVSLLGVVCVRTGAAGAPWSLVGVVCVRTGAPLSLVGVVAILPDGGVVLCLMGDLLLLALELCFDGDNFGEDLGRFLSILKSSSSSSSSKYLTPPLVPKLVV